MIDCHNALRVRARQGLRIDRVPVQPPQQAQRRRVMPSRLDAQPWFLAHESPQGFRTHQCIGCQQ